MTTTTTHKSISERKVDLFYLSFFLLHVVIILLVDITPLYPASIRPAFVDKVRSDYIEKYQDKFFSEPAAWGKAYIFMEAVYHLPLSIWAVGAILRDAPMVPVHLLVFAVQTFITTLTCLVDVWSWTDRTTEQKTTITYMYAPYAAFAALMGIDMFYRLKERVTKSKRD
ncbi:uncharacterized protein PADG_03208 [Paracoccidioides brasiliensis Pb18]|uniref:Efficient mitochondria targeting-associated protein 19 n=2 Tax=Paracoccidioides brasiliensis TaxID=121759 RepID=C1G7Q3_PARBD|nr:uncharacterized protein PADG_03208 [Paracoccidioides brasiliensis Pb18]EEH47110.1 hypothetical protein PADG_03208 [Paracoccidioides brasiliensis Pb18]ODH37351.1 hypothetical protein ACO22_02626 [Paracoccidioides brasiliensis]